MSSDESHPARLPYQPALDGLRGVSIAGVLAYHACAASGLTGWFRGGFVGVSVFFTLSGYLITSLLLAEHEQHGRVDVARFVTRRVRRLSPALLTVVTMVLVLSATGVLAAHASDITAATWSYTNWHVIGSGEARLLQTIVGPLGPTWSLGVEEQLYAVLLIGVLAAVGSHRPHRWLLVGASAVTLVSLLIGNLASDWNPRLEFGTDARAAEVALGVALAVLTRSGALPAITARRGDVTAGLGLALVLLAFLAVDLTPPWLLHGGYIALALVSAATITGLASGGRVAGALSAPGIVALGRISYSLYLVHWPVISILTANRLGFDGAPLALLHVTVSIGAATAIYLGIERPVRAMRPTRLAPTIAAHVAAGLAITAAAIAALP